MSAGLHQPSYQLGIIAAFSEMIDVGLKPLALSSPLPPSAAEDLLPQAVKVAASYGVMVTPESDLIRTLLFPSDIAKGKTVFLLYRDDAVIERYRALRQRALDLEAAADSQDPEAAKMVAREFGQLLGYPASRVDLMLRRHNL